MFSFSPLSFFIAAFTPVPRIEPRRSAEAKACDVRTEDRAVAMCSSPSTQNLTQNHSGPMYFRHGFPVASICPLAHSSLLDVFYDSPKRESRGSCRIEVRSQLRQFRQISAISTIPVFSRTPSSNFTKNVAQQENPIPSSPILCVHPKPQGRRASKPEEDGRLKLAQLRACKIRHSLTFAFLAKSCGDTTVPVTITGTVKFEYR